MISTLALSPAVVVVVLGLVLQTQIADRVLARQGGDALARPEAGRVLLERDLAGRRPGPGQARRASSTSALDRLTNASGVRRDPASPAAARSAPCSPRHCGDARPRGRHRAGRGRPADLRGQVAEGDLAPTYVTPTARASTVPTWVGQPVRTAGGDLEFYLLFPLDPEQRTLELVQSTLIVGGLVLLLLLAGIASLVTRQVVRPVRQAARDRRAVRRRPPRRADAGAGRGRGGPARRVLQRDGEQHPAQIRQLEEFGALQRRFTSDVSHELRTPLTTVRMAADVLHASKDRLLPALRRSSELLVTELDRFEALLADLLEISRLDAGVADLDAERVDVRGVVDARSRRCAASPTRRGHGAAAGPARRGVRGGRPAPGRADRAQPGGNAIDHGEGRPVEVTLACDEHAVAVLVRDHGVGLRPGEAELVFNRFWRPRSRGPAQRRQRAGPVDQHRGRPAARRLAAGLGRAGAGLRVPPDAAAHDRRGGRPLPLSHTGPPAGLGGDSEEAPSSSTSAPAAGSVPTPIGLPAPGRSPPAAPHPAAPHPAVPTPAAPHPAARVERAARAIGGPDDGRPPSRPTTGQGSVSRRRVGVRWPSCWPLLVGLGGCASAPESSPVQVLRQVGEGETPMLPPGPVDGSNPLDLVRDFVYSSGSSADRHGAARRFLAPAAATGTTGPGSRCSASSSTPSTPGASDPSRRTPPRSGSGTALGRMTADGSFEAAQRCSRWTSRWRVSTTSGGSRGCPTAVLVPLSNLRDSYRTVRTWFVDPVEGSWSRTCAYLPIPPGRSPPRAMELLFAGPSTVLQDGGRSCRRAQAAVERRP